MFRLIAPVRRSPPRFALLAKAGDAFNRFRRMAAIVEVTLSSASSSFETGAWPAGAASPWRSLPRLGLRAAVRRSAPPTLHLRRHREFTWTRPVRIAASPEALARQQITAQAAGVDGPQKERDQRPRRKAEPHLRQRKEWLARAITTSQHDTSATPPPMQAPWTSATIGFGRSSSARQRPGMVARGRVLRLPAAPPRSPPRRRNACRPTAAR